MQLLERKQKWVLYDDAGFVVIIASDVKICRSIMRRTLNEKKVWNKSSTATGSCNHWDLD